MTSRTATSGTIDGFPLYDAHGNNVGTLTRSRTSWAVGNERHYDAWGAVRSGATTGAPSNRYCASLGHVQDDESGLVYMRARYYEPSTGRFISEDISTDGLNWFSYCDGNPINSVDVSGKEVSLAKVLLVVMTLLVGAALMGALGTMALDKINQLRTAARWAATEEEIRKITYATKQIEEKMNDAMRASKGPKGGGGGAIAFLIGYSMVLKALCDDIDLGPEGEDALGTVFG